MKGFAAICGVGFLARLSYAMARNPALPLFAATLTTSDRGVGIAAAASTITGIAFKLPAGALSDIFGRRLILLGSMLFFAVMPFTYFFVHTYTALVAVRFIHGMATALYGPVAMAFVTDLAGERRGERLAWFSTLTSIGSLLAPIAGGLILDLSPQTGRREYMNVYLASGFVGGLALLLAPIVLARSRGGQLKERRTPGAVLRQFGQGLREVLGDRRVLLTSGAEALIMLASNALAVFLALYVTEVLQQKRWFVGMLFTVQVVSNLAIRPLMGALGDRIGRRPLVIAGLMIASLPLIVIWMFRAPLAAVPLMVVFGLGESLVTAATAALVADLCKQRNYGAAMGTFGTLYDAGEATGPIAVGVLKDAFMKRVPHDFEYLAYQYAFAPVAVLLLAAAVGFALLVREPERTIS